VHGVDEKKSSGYKKETTFALEKVTFLHEMKPGFLILAREQLRGYT
jgi:hypothetical protein